MNFPGVETYDTNIENYIVSNLYIESRVEDNKLKIILCLSGYGEICSTEVDIANLIVETIRDSLEISSEYTSDYGSTGRQLSLELNGRKISDTVIYID